MKTGEKPTSEHKSSLLQVMQLREKGKNLKPVKLDFDECTPLKLETSPVISGRRKTMRAGSGVRASFGGPLRKRITPPPSRLTSRNTAASSIVGGDAKSRTKRNIDSESQFPSDDSTSINISLHMPHLSKMVDVEDESPLTWKRKKSTPRTAASPIVGGDAESRPKIDSKSQFLSGDPNSINISLHMNLPGKLRILEKEAVQQRETARKIALQALRAATATENLVHSFKIFSNLTKSAKPNAPAACFDQFLDFHNQIVQVVAEMVSIQAATAASETVKKSNAEQREDSSVLHELVPNAMEEQLNSKSVASKRAALYKSIAAFPKRNEPKSILGKHLRSSTLNQMAIVPSEAAYENDENKKAVSTCSLSNTIKLGKQIETEAVAWFMEYLEQALEKGMKKSKGTAESDASEVPKSLILKVINWIEVEQSNPNKRPVHPRAALIKRKLRIKLKNPED